MKTVLILSNSGGGLIHFRKEVLAALCESYKVVVSIPEGQFNSSLEEIGTAVICSEMERRAKNPFKDLYLLGQYIALINRIKPDLILTYTIKPNVYGGLASQIKKTPYIANVTGLGTTIENGGLMSKISLALYRRGLKKASCVFFQNTENYGKFKKWGILSGNAIVIPGSGVNLTSHPFTKYPKESDPVKFLFIGRIMKDKGIEELLYAVDQVKLMGYGVELDIVGTFDENYRQKIKDAEAKGYVHYHGYQSDVNSFIKNAHCMVLPSYHEGMSNVMLEAASSGRPVITTNVPGCRETFDEGISGFGCEARNGDSLTDAMIKFLMLSNEERAAMGLQGRKKVEKEFDRKIIVEAYLEETRKALMKT